jgi:lysophospholipase L1-like esterase
MIVLCANLVFAQSDFSEEVEAIVSRSQEKGYSEPVIFIGSSSVRMWSTLEQDFPEFRILNHGFGGSEYKDLLTYQERLIEEFEPSMIVVYAGDNDIANGTEVSATLNKAEQFIDGLKRLTGGVPVIVLSTKPSIARWELNDKYIEFNTKLEKLLSVIDHAVYVDVWQPMLNNKGEVKTKLFLEDGLHMNEKGYQIWKNALKPFLSK